MEVKGTVSITTCAAIKNGDNIPDWRQTLPSRPVRPRFKKLEAFTQDNKSSCATAGVGGGEVGGMKQMRSMYTSFGNGIGISSRFCIALNISWHHRQELLRNATIHPP